MEENKRHQRTDDRNYDQDEPKTTHEIIREVNGGANTNLNELKDEAEGVRNNIESGVGNVLNTDTTRGVDYTPNDASAVRSGGTTDMDDQTGSSMGINTGTKRGFDSGIAQKRDVTGSDYDGQNSTSNP